MMMQSPADVVEEELEFSRVKMGIGASPGQIKKKKPSKEKLLAQVFAFLVQIVIQQIDQSYASVSLKLSLSYIIYIMRLEHDWRQLLRYYITGAEGMLFNLNLIYSNTVLCIFAGNCFAKWHA